MDAQGLSVFPFGTSSMAGSRSASPARRVAFAVLRRVFEQGAYADRTLAAEAERARLDARERALATRLAYGAVQRRGTLDHLIVRLADRPVERLDATVAAALRLGLLQLLFLDGVPAHAAVDESVELAKASPGRGAGLVNAVLRRAARAGPSLLSDLGDVTASQAAVRHSVPEWLAEMWWEELGADQARGLLRAVNDPAESALRANTLVGSGEALRAALRSGGVATSAAPEAPEALVLDGAFDAHSSPLWAAGAFMPQSRASQRVAPALAPRPGDRVLDLCAAPGGKTTHLAALMENRGELVAVERHAGRAAALARTAERMHAGIVEVRVEDAAAFVSDAPFDRVLVDPPCSGLGTLQSRPDLRWRVTPESIAGLLPVQAGILTAGARALRPGGVLVYSTCTISERENEARIAALLEADPGLEADGEPLRILPHRDGTDGFFVARVRRRSSVAPRDAV